MITDLGFDADFNKLDFDPDLILFALTLSKLLKNETKQIFLE